MALEKSFGQTVIFHNFIIIESFYKGEYKVGVKEGQGIYEWSQGVRYEGDWKNNEMHGWGVFFNDDEKYEGEFIDGVYDGNGRLVESSGEIYEGRFRDGMKHGIGTIISQNGTKFKGEWREDSKEGNGLYFDKRNNIHKQVWKDNKLLPNED